MVAVGCGWVTTHRHIPAIRATPGLELVAVVDRDRDRADAAGRRARVPAFTSLADAAVPDHDAVSIGTAPFTHHDLVLEAVRSGKHAIVEKPFAMSTGEAREMRDAARAAGRVLAVVHNFQFARSVRRARELVRSGRYGRLRGVVGLQLSNERRRLPTWYGSLPGGLFYDEAPHLLYLVRAFIGDEPALRSIVTSPGTTGGNTPRAIAVELGGADPERPFGSLYMNFAASLSEWQLLVLCAEATLACDIFRDVLTVVPDDGLHRPGQIMRTSMLASLGHWGGVVSSGLRFASGRLDYGNNEVFRRFAAAVREGASLEGISADDGVAVVTALHRALASPTAPRD